MLESGGWEMARDALDTRVRSAETDLHAGVVVLDPDQAMPMAALGTAMAAHGRIPWIAILKKQHISEPSVRDLIARSCVDFLTLPLAPERLLFSLGHAVGMAELVRSGIECAPGGADPSRIVGESPVMLRLRRNIEKLAASDAPVLMLGESGTGKELVSRAIHDNSSRREKPFVAVNCISLSPSLIHAELFGYERGAFTGATQRKIGHLESSNGGTILLDEIGDLHPDLQVLLLRFLEERTIQRVGGRETIHVDARVIAATHVNLEQAVAQRRFREDLYYRLNVLSLTTPPLRDRGRDIELLARSFLDRLCGNTGRAQRFSPATLAALRAHPWPGNVRELLNRVHRAVVMADGPTIDPEDLGLGSPAEALGERLADVRADAETHLIHSALAQGGGNASRAAQIIGVSRATFYRMLDRRGLASDRRLAPRRVDAPPVNDPLAAGTLPQHLANRLS